MFLKYFTMIFFQFAAPQARAIDAMLFSCWDIVCDSGPAWRHHWFNIWFSYRKARGPVRQYYHSKHKTLPLCWFRSDQLRRRWTNVKPTPVVLLAEVAFNSCGRRSRYTANCTYYLAGAISSKSELEYLVVIFSCRCSARWPSSANIPHPPPSEEYLPGDICAALYLVIERMAWLDRSIK